MEPVSVTVRTVSPAVHSRVVDRVPETTEGSVFVVQKDGHAA